MRAAKRKKLEGSGWRVADAREFLNLSHAEVQFVEVKLALARLLRKLRTGRRLTQMELAERLGSSQSRVAKLEAGDPSVSVDLLVRSALAAGATKKDLAQAFFLVGLESWGRLLLRLACKAVSGYCMGG